MAKAAAVTTLATAAADTSVSMITSTGHVVSCAIKIDNWTDVPLLKGHGHTQNGQIKSVPISVEAGSRAVAISHKRAFSMAGCSGTMVWEYHDTRIVVMWSTPYYVVNDNYLAIGFLDKGAGETVDGKNLYWRMLHDDPGHHSSGLIFARGCFVDDCIPISVKNHEIEVSGTMGSTRNCEAHIVVRVVS